MLGEIPALPISDCRFPIGTQSKTQQRRKQQIGKRKSTMTKPAMSKNFAATDPVRRAREASWLLRRAIPIHNSRAAILSSKIRDLQKLLSQFDRSD